MQDLNGNGMTEKRRTYRFRPGAGFRCELLKDGHPCEGFLMQDASAGGLGVWSERPLEEGICLETRMFFPGEAEPVRATSKVVRCSKEQRDEFPYTIGIEHVEFCPEDQERFISLFCDLMVDTMVCEEEDGDGHGP